MNQEQAIKEVDKAIDQLREFFPAVQVLVSWEDDDNGNTFDLFRGKGNFYARTGMAHDFLTRDKSHVQAHEIRKQLKDDSEEE